MLRLKSEFKFLKKKKHKSGKKEFQLRRIELNAGNYGLNVGFFSVIIIVLASEHMRKKIC